MDAGGAVDRGELRLLLADADALARKHGFNEEDAEPV